MDAQGVQKSQAEYQAALGEYRADDPKGSENLAAALKVLNKALDEFIKGPAANEPRSGDAGAGSEGGSAASGYPGASSSGAPGSPGTGSGAPAGGDTPQTGNGLAPASGTDGKDKTDKPSGDSGPLSTEAQTSANSPEESKKVAEQYVSQLQKDFGLSKEQAQGVVANLWHESMGMNSGINQGGNIGPPSSNNADDNANGYGMAQWGGVRKEGLIEFAKENGMDPSSQAASYGYLKKELSGEFSGVIDALKSTKTSEEALSVFCKQFEKASDPQMESRIQILSNFT
jgi:hypothetical protein